MRIIFTIFLSLWVAAPFLAFSQSNPAVASEADLILYNGKVVTVDSDFSIQQAMAVKDNRILRVGDNEVILRLKADTTEVINLDGKVILPGFIDSHVHPCGACMTEFDHPIPQMDSVGDVLDYIRWRADVLDAGDWIIVQQVFITRLREQRYPTREELDRAAPKNPVVFRTGPDASLNSLALKLSNIDRDFRVTDGGPGYIERDSETGEPTGILRGCTRYIKSRASAKILPKTTDISVWCNCSEIIIPLELQASAMAQQAGQTSDSISRCLKTAI